MFKKFKLLIIMFLLISIPSVSNISAAVSAVSVSDLKCEYLTDPLGVDTNKPRFSWKLSDSNFTRGQKQTAYRVLVSSSLTNLNSDNGDLWDSGKMTSEQSVNIDYNGITLTSGKDCYWKAQVWDKDNYLSNWSVPARFSVGLLNISDWTASWIGMATAGDHDQPWFRKKFNISSLPGAALAYIGSIGYHELYVNGQKVGSQVLAPSVSDLQKRALYLTYDLKSYLQTGDNVVAIWLGPGWSLFRGVNPIMDFNLSKKPLLIGEVHLINGGNTTKVLTDNTWKCRLSSSKHLGEWTNSNFGGDQIDARNYIAGWNGVSLNDSAWENATVYTLGRTLSSDLLEPNRKCETINPVSVTNIGTNKYKVDMGKLYTGWVEVRLSGGAGSKVTFKSSSNSGTECEYNQLDEYIFDSSGQGTFCNQFTYHELRYLIIEGITYTPALADIKGYRIGNDRKRVGTFDCSNTLLKQIYDYTLNTYVNLSTGGMTVDCPHRERLGYGGDGHSSMEAALNNYESGAFFTKWARDWCDIQEADGRIAHTAPTIDGGGGPGWSGLVVTMPWEVYQTYGDKRILDKTYPYMKLWLAYLDIKDDANSLLQKFGGSWDFLGDWATPHGNENADSVEALLFNNCYYLYTTRIVSKVAQVLGYTSEANTYAAKAEAIKTATNNRFFNTTSKIYLDTEQTHCALPLISGAVAPEYINDVVNNLRNEIVVTKNGHLDTGIHGTYFMTKYLTENDRSDLVFTYASQTTAPSYGDLINHGFNTWPEYWDSASSSKIHGCLNGIGAWFQEGLTGIRFDPDYPGFKQFLIKPALAGDLTWAKADYESIYGKITSDWSVSGGNFTHNLEIPVNTTATVYIPADNVNNVMEGGIPASGAPGVQYLRTESARVVFLVQSGKYQFTAILPGPTPTPTPTASPTPDGYVLAPRNSATASSTVNSSWPVSKIMDNITGNNNGWSSTVNGQTGLEWVYIDMGQNYNTGRVKLIPRTNEFGTILCFPEDFKFQYSTDSVNWTDVPGQSYTGYTNPTTNSGEVFTFGSAVTTRYLKLVGTKFRHDEGPTTYYLQIAEMYLYYTGGSSTPTPTPTPTSTSAVTAPPTSTPTPTPTAGFFEAARSGVTVSSTVNTSWPASKIMDNLTGNENGWSSVVNNQTGLEWVYLDLGQNYNIGRVKLIPRTNPSGTILCFPEDFKFQYSINATTWTDVPGQSYTGYPSPMTNNGEVFTFGSPVTARYIKLIATKFRHDEGPTTYYLQIAEMYLYYTGAATQFSDNFNDNNLGSAWTTYNGTWSESGMVLGQTSTGNGDPKKAIISNSGVTFPANQTITTKVRVNSWVDGDGARAGVGLFTGTSNGGGYNLLFHNNHSTLQLLDDVVAWGPSYTFNWTNGTWYWFKLKMESGALYGKVWQDGATEPMSWAYSWQRSGRTGYPALNGGSSISGAYATVSFDDVSVVGN